MTRWTDTGTTAAFDAEHVEFAVLVEMQFASGTIRVFSGYGQITYDGQTYSGLGEYGSISEIVERPDGRDYSEVTLELSGVDTTLSSALTDRDEYFGRTASIYVVPFGSRTLQPVAVEPAVYEGFMDVMEKSRSAGQVSFSVKVRHHMTEWAKSVNATYTDAYQRSIDNADLFFDKTHTVTTRQIFWGGGVVATGVYEPRYTPDNIPQISI